MAIQLGIIADDFTGATDIAGLMTERGWNVIQLLKIPQGNIELPQNIDAIVISLKSRSIEARLAIEQSLHALRWLQTHTDCHRFYFKYCSTFDSTNEGNIGPVTDALLTALNSKSTLLCPALPINGRTVVHGYLFVNGLLLNESGMQFHPITPMTDANVRRLIEAQGQGDSGLIDLATIMQGVSATQKAITQLIRADIRYLVADCLTMTDLDTLAQASSDFPLLTGGSGLAGAIAKAAVASTNPAHSPSQNFPPKQGARTVILSGSASTMTNHQVSRYQAIAPTKALDIDACLQDKNYATTLAQWVVEQSKGAFAPMLYATMQPQQLRKIQYQYGAKRAGEAIEKTFGQVARKLKHLGFNRFIIAGGETSGRVVQDLACEQLFIGAPIAPGVPWVHDVENDIWLALKSGNFGEIAFFQQAQAMYTDSLS